MFPVRYELDIYIPEETAFLKISLVMSEIGLGLPTSNSIFPSLAIYLHRKRSALCIILQVSWHILQVPIEEMPCRW
jgi:hypothetical protein